MEENRINIGELDTMITVVAVTHTIGAQGQKKRSASTYGQVWAKLDWQESEQVADGNLEDERVVEVSMYKIPALTSRWQILIDNIPFEIVQIDPISRWSPLCRITCRTMQR